MSNRVAPVRWCESRRSGQGLVEYVLIAALAAIGLVLALTVFRNQIGSAMDSANAGLQSAPAAVYAPGSGSGGGAGTGTGTGGTPGGGNSGASNGRGGGQGSGRGGGRGNSN